jgi:stage V sporulation protein D (sporulation-specific penicillin-binding protein)
LPHLKLSGKTGTAQKASKNGGYAPGRFISSFVGFAPHDDPKIVCLVVLDEPNSANRFGGVSAAPVFARVSEAVSQSTSLLDGALIRDVVDPLDTVDREVTSFKAPNLLRLERTIAMERARELTLNVLCHGDSGTVVLQAPSPGVPMTRDEVIRLRLSGTVGGSEEQRETPDLRGLSLRMAKRRAIEAGFRCSVVGSGVVASQRPAPGTSSSSGVVKIICKDRVASRRG